MKAIKAEQDYGWTTLERVRSLTSWVVTTLKKCVRDAASNGDEQCEVEQNNVVWCMFHLSCSLFFWHFFRWSTCFPISFACFPDAFASVFAYFVHL